MTHYLHQSIIHEFLSIMHNNQQGHSKDKGHPITCHEVTDRKYRYRSTISLTSALDVGGWFTTLPGRFNPGKARYTLYRRLNGLHGQSGWGTENFATTGIRSPDRPARRESLYRLGLNGLKFVMESKYVYL